MTNTKTLRLVASNGATVSTLPAGPTVKRTAEKDTITTGAKYSEGRDVTEIAKLLRADIANAQGRDLPAGIRCSVRVQRFAGGRSITITVTRFPSPVRVTDEATIEAGRGSIPKPWFTREAYAAELALVAMLDAYRTERANWQSDYCHTNFYAHVAWGLT